MTWAVSKPLARSLAEGCERLVEHVIDGDPPVTVHLRVSARARRISLRVSRLDGKVTLTHPKGVPATEALAFAHDRADWLRGHVTEVPTIVPVVLGSQVLIEGDEVRILPGAGRRVVRSGDQLQVPGPDRRVPKQVETYLKTLARDRLAQASDAYAQRLGKSFQRISLRDTRSRWGSCSSRGTLMYSWRLIMAPPEVLQYVAAHEVAHLAEMNHSRAYWDGLLRIHGPYEGPRRWLREHGGQLHRYQFST